MTSKRKPYGQTKDERKVLEAMRMFRDAGLSMAATKVQLAMRGCYDGPISRTDLQAWWSDQGGDSLFGEEE